MRFLTNHTFYLIVCILLFAAVEIGNTQNVANYSPVDSLKVGDTFNYSIVLKKNTSYDTILFPDSSQFGEPIEILQRKRYKIDDYTDSVAYTLQFFGTEDHTIPKLPVHLIASKDTNTSYVPPVPINFKSTVQAGEEELSPLKPIFDFARNWWPYVLGTILLAVLLWLGYKWYRRWTERQSEEKIVIPEPEPFVNPLTELENELNALKNDFNLQQNREFKVFYIRLGDAIRSYFENLYDIPALESTSGELLRMLDDKAIDAQLISHTRDVLREADMVKFAKFNPTLDQANRALDKAEKFLQRAKKIDLNRIENVRREHYEREEQRIREFKQKHNLTETEEVA